VKEVAEVTHVCVATVAMDASRQGLRVVDEEHALPFENEFLDERSEERTTKGWVVTLPHPKYNPVARKNYNLPRIVAAMRGGR